jgi:hypothetical protein
MAAPAKRDSQLKPVAACDLICVKYMLPQLFIFGRVHSARRARARRGRPVFTPFFAHFLSKDELFCSKATVFCVIAEVFCSRYERFCVAL